MLDISQVTPQQKNPGGANFRVSSQNTITVTSAHPPPRSFTRVLQTFPSKIQTPKQRPAPPTSQKRTHTIKVGPPRIFGMKIYCTDLEITREKTSGRNSKKIPLRFSLDLKGLSKAHAYLLTYLPTKSGPLSNSHLPPFKKKAHSTKYSYPINFLPGGVFQISHASG